jgi:hypothetical protein
LNHSHTASQSAHNHTYSIVSGTAQAVGGSGSSYFTGTATTNTGNAQPAITVDTSTTGGTETRPDNYAVLYIIKT